MPRRFATAIFWQNERLFYFFFALVLINAVLSYHGVLTILATIATSLSTWAAFRPSDKQFRLFLIAAASVMMVHNMIAWTPAAIVMEVFFISSNVLAYRRLYR